MDLKNEIQNLINLGISRRHILKKLSISSFTLSKLFPKEKSEKGINIIELRNQGKTLTEIKSITGYSKSTISKYIEQSNVIKPLIKKNKLQQFSEKKRIKNKIKKEKSKSQGSINGKRNLSLRKRKKQFLISAAGSSCQVCGYQKCSDALSFHHKDELDKHFSISGSNLSSHCITRLVEEASKCVLLCFNCHMEVHANLLDVSNLKLDYSGLKIPEELLKQKILSDDEMEKEKRWIKSRLSERIIEFIDLPISNILNIKLEIGDPQIINSYLNKYHYLGENRKEFIKCFKFVENETTVGGCFITNPIRRNFNGKPTCEINRFVLLSHQNNVASKCLSLVIKEMKLSHYNYIEAYADSEIHEGTIYKATNFQEVNSGFKTYNYSGIHKKTIYERSRRLGITEHEYAKIFELKRIREAPKRKFVFKLND